MKTTDILKYFLVTNFLKLGIESDVDINVFINALD